MPSLKSLDHLVLTVADIERTCEFYTDVLGMKMERFQPSNGTIRTALTFGVQKINLHEKDAEFEPKSDSPTPGSGDLCFVTETALEDWQSHLKSLGIPVIEGPVARTGALGPMTSIYLRDPDGNLLEIAIYDR